MAAINQPNVLTEVNGRRISTSLLLDIKRPEKQSAAMKHATQDVVEGFPQYYVKNVIWSSLSFAGKIHVPGGSLGKNGSNVHHLNHIICFAVLLKDIFRPTFRLL